ncbi:MAG: hypothetical protein PHD53_02115 [Methylococcales bacterium]|nr:hypothetical protein [Methylococcales bacterium]
MKKYRFVLPLAFCSSFLNVALADSLDTLLNDVNKRISIVEKTGICSIANPNSTQWKPCEAVTAKCPMGTRLVPDLSKCDFLTLNNENISTGYQYMVYPVKDSNQKNDEQKCSAFNMTTEVVNIKTTAVCAKLPKALPTILKRFGINNF